MHTYRYIYICTALKQGWEGFFSCGQRPLMTSWPCSDQADQLG